MAGSGSAPPKLEFYPQYCFHLSPTIGRWCHLQATDIAALTFNPGFEGQDVYFYLNHPIKWARIAGVVVAIQEFAHRIIYTIDDGSGATIECVVATPPQFSTVANYKNPKDPNTSADGKPLPKLDGPIDVGHIIDIKGGISVFRDAKQIRAEKVTHLRTTEQEAVFWEKIALLRKEVLCRPWVLDQREVRKLRREEEGRVKKQKRTGLEKESKRRKLEEDTAESEGRDRARPLSRTGLERGSMKSGGVVAAEVAKDDRHAHHHWTGLEPRAATRTVVQDEEPGSPDRCRRKTGLESQRHSGGDHDRRPASCAKQPLERPDLDETMSTSHVQLKTGLERRSSRSTSRVGPQLSSHQIRQTGLQKSSVLEMVDDDTTLGTSRLAGLSRPSLSRKFELGPTIQASKTWLEKSSTFEAPDNTTLSITRSTGLEKRSSRTIVQQSTLTALSQKTGLERTSSSRRRDTTEDATVMLTSNRPRRTGLERAIGQRTDSEGHKTGLESQNSRDDDKQATARHRSTGLEPRKQSQQSSNPSQPWITGLERQSGRRALAEKSSQNSPSDQQLQEEDKCGLKTTTLRSSSIRRPDSLVLVRGNGRLTGLERVTKPITRGSPVTGKYDSMGL